MKKVGLNYVVPPVVLLHSIYVFVTVSSLLPLINLIAFAVSFIDKSIDILDFVALEYLSTLVLVFVNSMSPFTVELPVMSVSPPIVKLVVTFTLFTAKSLFILIFPDGFKFKSATLSSLVAFDVILFPCGLI